MVYLFGSADEASEGEDDLPAIELTDLSDLLPPAQENKKEVGPPKVPKMKKSKPKEKKEKAAKKTVSEVIEKWTSGKRTSKVDLKRISRGWASDSTEDPDTTYKLLLNYMEAYRLCLSVTQFGLDADPFNSDYVPKATIDDIFAKCGDTFSINPRVIINSYIRAIEAKGELQSDEAIVNTASTFFVGLRYKMVPHRGNPTPIMYALLQSAPCKNCDCLSLTCASCLFTDEINDANDFDLIITRRFLSSLPFAPQSMAAVRTRILSLL